MEAINSSEAVQDAKNQSSSSNQECELPGSISAISGSKGPSERSDQGENLQFDPKEKPLEGFYLKMVRPRTRNPGKKAMAPRKGENIFARKKGRDLWFLYKYLGKEHQRGNQESVDERQNHGWRGSRITSKLHRMVIRNK